MVKPIGVALGVTYTERKNNSNSNVLPDDLPVEEVLALIGGKGTMIKRNGR